MYFYAYLKHNPLIFIEVKNALNIICKAIIIKHLMFSTNCKVPGVNKQTKVYTVLHMQSTKHLSSNPTNF
jgi:hypothetical protein